MSEMTSVDDDQYLSDDLESGHRCKDCGLKFESDKSLDVHLRYHHDNLLNRWGNRSQHTESNNNNSKAGNHNTHVVSKRDSVTAPADSSESSSRTPSASPATSQHQQQQSVQPPQPPSTQQQPPPGAQGYNHFQTPLFNETSYFMHNEQAYLLPQGMPHHYSPTHDDGTNNSGGNYAARYHPYQHQQHFVVDRANSVSSTSPRSPLQCDKCGGVFDDANQLGEHVRANHPASPNNYSAQSQYQQLGNSPQQIHASPPQNNQHSQPSQQQVYEYNGGPTVKTEVKQEQEEQAEILDLDSHKVQTHRYEEELMRLHQHQQEIQMQLHQQQHQQQQQQQQQQQVMQHRSAAHSVSSMLGWPPGQPHEYHPGLSPMGPLDNVSPIPDQGAFMRGQHLPVEPPRHAGSPIITSTQPMPGHGLPPGLLQQPTKPPTSSNQSWKSNEARRPKTYNCTACNKWFTSSGHLKRHYNTTLHKNAVKQSNQPDPANMPISAHHHPGRDANQSHSNKGGPARSPELSTSGSPPNLMAGPSVEAARGLLHTPTNLYTTSTSSNSSTNSNSSDSSAVVLLQQQQQQQQQQHHHHHHHHHHHQQQQQQQQSAQQAQSSTVHMGSSMVGLSSPVTSPMGVHHHQQMGSQSPQLGQHHLSIGSPSQLSAHHPMNSPMSPMPPPPPPPQSLNSPSHQIATHHPMTSPSPIMAGVPPMGSPPMGGTSMPHQPYPNALPPHVTTTTSIPGLLESITNQLITTGSEIPIQSQQQQTQDTLPGFGTFSNHQRPLPSFTQFSITGFLVGHNSPQAVNVGGLSPEEGVPPTRSFGSTGASYDSYSPPRYESLTNMDIQEIQQQHQQTNTDGMIIKQYEVLQNHHQFVGERHLETNNNLPHDQGKEEINPNIGKQQQLQHQQQQQQQQQQQHVKDDKKVIITKEHQVTSTGSHYISQDGFHKCIKCNKNFNKACYLTQHNKSFHSGEKPYKCNQCGKRFPLEYLHSEHLLKHAGDKPYKCEICPKQFNHKTDLRRHMCLHTGEKPFECRFCKKGFIRKDHMMKHLDTHNRKNNNNNINNKNNNKNNTNINHNLHLRA